jgi:hypothetical protein
MQEIIKAILQLATARHWLEMIARGVDSRDEAAWPWAGSASLSRVATTYRNPGWLAFTGDHQLPTVARRLTGHCALPSIVGD